MVTSDNRCVPWRPTVEDHEATDWDVEREFESGATRILA